MQAPSSDSILAVLHDFALDQGMPVSPDWPLALWVSEVYPEMGTLARKNLVVESPLGFCARNTGVGYAWSTASFGPDEEMRSIYKSTSVVRSSLYDGYSSCSSRRSVRAQRFGATVVPSGGTSISSRRGRVMYASKSTFRGPGLRAGRYRRWVDH